MRRVPRRAWIVAALTVLGAAMSAGVALAAIGAPSERAPRQGHTVRIGRARFVVYEPGLRGPDATVYLAIRRDRRLDRDGYLDHTHCDVAKGCDFVTMSRWARHPGYWTYAPNRHISFPGYWATTPGRYFWQASIVASTCNTKGCILAGPIHRFRLIR